MFDAYRKWLGIQPKDQPPNHYRLLSLDVYETDLDVIEGAADRAMGFIRQYQSGEHAALAAKLLNEIALARLCLLKPDSKAAYDATLRAQSAVPQSGNETNDVAEFAFNSNSSSAPVLLQKPIRKKANSPLGLWIASGIGAAVCLLLAWLMLASGGKRPATVESRERAVARSEVKSIPSKEPPPRVENVVEKPIDKSLVKPVAKPVEVKAEVPETPRLGDGDVVLFVNVNSGRCMTAKNGYKIVQGPLADQAGVSEHWKAVAIGFFFKLVNVSNGSVLAVPATSFKSGEQLILWKDGDLADQQWRIVAVDKGIAITSRSSGMAVGIANSSRNSDAAVTQRPLDKALHQIWRIQHVVPSTGEANGDRPN